MLDVRISIQTRGGHPPRVQRWPERGDTLAPQDKGEHENCEQDDVTDRQPSLEHGLKPHRRSDWPPYLTVSPWRPRADTMRYSHQRRTPRWWRAQGPCGPSPAVSSVGISPKRRQPSWRRSHLPCFALLNLCELIVDNGLSTTAVGNRLEVSSGLTPSDSLQAPMHQTNRENVAIATASS